MDVTASIPRLSAYFAFGVQLDPGKARSGAASPRTDATSDARPGRVIDVTAQSVDPNGRRNAPAAAPRKANIFLGTPAATTYAPPARPGQAVRVLQTAPALGQNLDSWA